jgi:tRNA A-37 threonylcarbamoyl transferase component Bud32
VLRSNRKKATSANEPLRINVAWLHQYSEWQSYTQVIAKEGGGTRFINVPPSATVEMVTEAARQRYSDSISKKACFASISDYSIGMTKDGAPITEFRDSDDNPCGLHAYLVRNGWYASKSTFYLITSTSPTKSGTSNSSNSNSVAIGSDVIKDKTLSASVVLSNSSVLPMTELSDMPKSDMPITSERDQHYVSSKIPFVAVEDFNIDLNKLLGKGGFGEVYEGTWLGTQVAVKKVAVPRLSMSTALISREVKLLSHLSHPNIVLMLAIATSGKHLYVCTEYVDGASLEGIIFDDDCTFILSEDNKHNIATQILQAIAYMHSQNIIHQDIKPANILVTKQSLKTKLCDLGIGKLVGDNGTITSRNTGNPCNPGTPLYMAPECLMNTGKGNKASDMWSTGATVIELYTGLAYWQFSEDDFADATNMLDCLMKKIQRRERPGIINHENFKEKIPTTVQSLLDRCIQYDHTARPGALEIVPTWLTVTAV